MTIFVNRPLPGFEMVPLGLYLMPLLAMGFYVTH